VHEFAAEKDFQVPATIRAALERQQMRSLR
jgi:hypothetical protein